MDLRSGRVGRDWARQPGAVIPAGLSGLKHREDLNLIPVRERQRSAYRAECGAVLPVDVDSEVLGLGFFLGLRSRDGRGCWLAGPDRLAALVALFQVAQVGHRLLLLAIEAMRQRVRRRSPCQARHVSGLSFGGIRRDRPGLGEMAKTEQASVADRSANDARISPALAVSP